MFYTLRMDEEEAKWMNTIPETYSDIPYHKWAPLNNGFGY